MILTYSHVYCYENRYNPIGRNWFEESHRILILQFFIRLFVYSYKRARSLEVSDLHSETKGPRFESGN